MKKRNALVVILLALALALPCVAHSGRTDASGGHYDNSTGEYHFHHGKPAHKHYADGSCPYAIKAQQEAERREEERLKREAEEKAATKKYKNSELGESLRNYLQKSGGVISKKDYVNALNAQRKAIGAAVKSAVDSATSSRLPLTINDAERKAIAETAAQNKAI